MMRTAKRARIDTVVLSTQHDPEVTQEQIHEDVRKYIFDPVLPEDMLDEKDPVFINPTGRFVIGGPHGDSGLTGRKIIVDSYGGYARHGGGAFSGKDCTKVDRSAAYAARYVAKILLRPDLPINVKFSFPMRSAWHSQPPLWSIPSAPERFRNQTCGYYP